jgi:hypothetical protein
LPKYNQISNIPAKVFFEILKTKNYQLLKPKPREKGLEEIFISIYDEFFIKSDNLEAKRYLELNKNIAFLHYKIAIIKQTLAFLYYSTTTRQMRIDYLEALKIGCGIEINVDVDFSDEVKRILTENIGWIENDLAFDEAELKEMLSKSQNKDYDYYDSIGVLSNVLPNNSLLKEDMTLAVYITLEKLAQKVVSQQNKKVA